MMIFFTSWKRAVTHRKIMKSVMLYASVLAAIWSCGCTDDSLIYAFEKQRLPASRFTVSFNTAGGTPATITPVTVDSGSALGNTKFPSNPTRAGYTFGGWYYSNEQYVANTPITRNVTLTAKWTIKQFMVSFNANGGSPTNIAQVTVDSGNTLGTNFPTNPRRDGFSFNGWIDDKGIKYIAQTTITRSITLTAAWTPNVPATKKFTVSFNTNGGSPNTISAVTVDSGGIMGTNFPAATPTRQGYEFGGWFDGETQYTAATKITKDVALTARWATRLFTVSFNTNGGEPSMVSAVTVDSGKTLGTGTNLPADPTRAGYNFDGWFDGSVQYTPTTVIIKNVTLIAGWTIKRFTVLFNTDGGTPNYIDPITVDSGKTLGTLPTVTKMGHDFDRWVDTSTDMPYAANTPITKGVTLTAVWTVKRFTVSFNSNGGTPNPSTVIVDSGTTFRTVLPTVTRSGFSFGGWFEGTTWVTLYDSSTIITNTVTLRARWIPRYTVTFNTNGGSPSISAVTVDSGNALKMGFPMGFPTNLTRTNHTLGGWSEGATQYDSNTIIIKNVTLTAWWATFYDTRDGKTYKAVRIGNYTWMAENLNYATTSSWCYQDSSSYCNTYGRLYDWSAATKACPSGWRLPNRNEWNNLVQAAGGSTAGNALKSTNGWGWESNGYVGNGENTYGFSALPGGSRVRVTTGEFFFGHIGNQGGWWWSATEYNSSSANAWEILDNSDGVSDFSYYKYSGFSVRCVQD